MKKYRQERLFHSPSDTKKAQNLMIIFIILVVAACGSTRPLFQPTEREAAMMSTPDKKIAFEDLQNGYKLYVSNCGGCHPLHVPSSIQKTAWDKVLPVMFYRAKLNEEQQELIRQYVYSKL